MSDVAARIPHLTHSPSMPTAAREPQVSQLRVLLWKEWREQQLLLAAIAALIVFVAASQRMHEFLECDVAAVFCTVMSALLLGAATGSEGGAQQFLTASPIHARLVWVVKLVFGLMATAVSIVASMALCWLFAPLWQEVSIVSTAELPEIGLCCFCLSHYCACFVRSPISAIALGLLTGIVTLAAVNVNPAYTYLSGQSRQLAVRVLVFLFDIGLLVLAARRFALATSRERPITRRRLFLWILAPVAIFGVLPQLAGLATFGVDLLHLDPTDVKRLTGIAVSPDGDRVFAFGKRAERYEWIPGLPSFVVVSASSRERRARQAFTLPGTANPIDYTWSPDDRHLVTYVSWPRRNLGDDLVAGPLAIIDMEDGSTSDLPSASWVHWLSDGRLVFYVAPRLGRHEWGTYDPETHGLATFPLPPVASAEVVYFRGFLTNPLRVILGNYGQTIYVVELREGRVDPRPIPSAYRASLPFKGTNLMLLVPRRERHAPRPDLPLLLLDASTGECENLETRLGGPPSAGWADMVPAPTWEDRWLLLVPDADSKSQSSPWYALDVAQNRVFRHQSPAPRALTPRVSSSGWLASLGSDGRTLLLGPLRDTDTAARLAVVPRSGEFRLDLDRSAWLTGTRFAFCVIPESWSRSRPAGWLRGLDAPGIFIVDVETRHVQPLWAPGKMRNHWQVKPWPARRGRKQ